MAQEADDEQPNQGEPDFETGMFKPDRTRVYVRGRYFPGIGISRSFGDYQAHTIGVSSEP